jgi:uncharacterized protein YdeI (YjbR/CyaY-like superfamily)
MQNMNPAVDFFFNNTNQWQAAYNCLRTIVLACGLKEELKWGVPCYTFQQSNIVLIHGFKAYCALLFHKGALLQDSHNILIQQTANVQAARQLRFTSSEEIMAMEEVLKAYILEAIAIEKAGLKVALKKPEDFKMSAEFKVILASTPAVKRAFEALSPGRQKAYLLYFSAPKQAKTRMARIEIGVTKILEGKGLND